MLRASDLNLRVPAGGVETDKDPIMEIQLRSTDSRPDRLTLMAASEKEAPPQRSDLFSDDRVFESRRDLHVAYW